MGFSCGIVGLPNVGKSTLFNALTRGTAEVANYPFTTLDSNKGVVSVPDTRLDVVARMANSSDSYPTAIQFVDIAGLVKGASRGEGLGNRFLGHIREVDAVVHVVRSFLEDTVGHVASALDPVTDVRTVTFEMACADVETIERRREKTLKAYKGNPPGAKEELSHLDYLQEALEQGRPIRTLDLPLKTRLLADQLFLLTDKPTMYVANVSEGDAADPNLNPFYPALSGLAADEGAPLLAIAGKIESEIMELSPEDAEIFLEDLGLNEAGSKRLVNMCYKLLDLITFCTANSKEARAWTIRRGTLAPNAAGKIHSDMEKRFVAAEVVPVEALEGISSYGQAKERGLVRLEGREYEMCDGDLVFFRFS